MYVNGFLSPCLTTPSDTPSYVCLWVRSRCFTAAVLSFCTYVRRPLRSRGDPVPSNEYTRPLLIWDFQYDSYVSVSCRLGLLDYYWVPSSTWLAFLVVYWCALSLTSSLFSEVSRMTLSSLLRGLAHEFSARLASTLWLGDVIQ